MKPFLSSEPIPENNSEPVKVVVTDSLEEMVFNSGKNGAYLIISPIFDATANDIPKGKFEVKGFPTLYFKSASGNLLQYEGNRTKEDIIDFIQKNRDKTIQSGSATSEEPSSREEL
nr:protein disulfide-isomerase-like [Ipomoea batatas]